MKAAMVALAVMLAVITAHTANAERENLCKGWAVQMRHPRVQVDDFRLHSMGCQEKRDGVWIRSPYRCMRVAYAVSRHQFNPVKIGRAGCVWFEDGTWGDE